MPFITAEITRKGVFAPKNEETRRQNCMEKFKNGRKMTKHFSESQTIVRETERSHKFQEYSWKELACPAAEPTGTQVRVDVNKWKKRASNSKSAD